jgi:hypothetical protein
LLVLQRKHPVSQISLPRFHVALSDHSIARRENDFAILDVDNVSACATSTPREDSVSIVAMVALDLLRRSVGISELLGLPAQKQDPTKEEDPWEEQREESQPLWPHQRKKAVLLDLSPLLDERLPPCFLDSHQSVRDRLRLGPS